jgi:hypothetical protein
MSHPCLDRELMSHVRLELAYPILLPLVDLSDDGFVALAIKCGSPGFVLQRQ